jgi:hypothetical protein
MSACTSGAKDYIERTYETKLPKGLEVLWHHVNDNLGGYEHEEWFLVRIPDGSLAENEAFHCSCMGYEGQWHPTPTSLVYLLSDHFGAAGMNAEDKAEFRAWLSGQTWGKGES